MRYRKPVYFYYIDMQLKGLQVLVLYEQMNFGSILVDLVFFIIQSVSFNIVFVLESLVILSRQKDYRQGLYNRVSIILLSQTLGILHHYLSFSGW